MIALLVQTAYLKPPTKRAPALPRGRPSVATAAPALLQLSTPLVRPLSIPTDRPMAMSPLPLTVLQSSSLRPSLWRLPVTSPVTMFGLPSEVVCRVPIVTGAPNRGPLPIANRVSLLAVVLNRMEKLPLEMARPLASRSIPFVGVPNIGRLFRMGSRSRLKVNLHFPPVYFSLPPSPQSTCKVHLIFGPWPPNRGTLGTGIITPLSGLVGGALSSFLVIVPLPLARA